MAEVMLWVGQLRNFQENTLIGRLFLERSNLVIEEFKATDCVSFISRQQCRFILENFKLISEPSNWKITFYLSKYLFDNFSLCQITRYFHVSINDCNIFQKKHTMFLKNQKSVKQPKSKNVEFTTAKRTKSINLTIFLMRTLGLWHASRRTEKLLSNVMLVITLISMLFSMVIQGQELYYSRKNITIITFAAPCACVVLSEFSKLTVFMMKRKKVVNLNKFVDENFWRKNYEKRELEIFNKCDASCFQAMTAYVCLLQIVCWHYLLLPVIENTGGHSVKREFPFPIRIELPVYDTPYYEIFFILEIFGTMAVCLCTTTFASYLFAINLFTAAQFKMLNTELLTLCNFEEVDDKKLKLQVEAHGKLKKLIIKHQKLIDLTKEIEDLYCYVMLGQVFGSVTQISFCGSQILLAKTTLHRNILSIEFLLSSFMQLYIYCHSSHEIFIASESVSRAVYFTKWFRITDPRIQKDFGYLLRMIMMRARRPCVLSVGKFYPLTLVTFASVLRTSLSYFTVLRQTIK